MEKIHSKNPMRKTLMKYLAALALIMMVVLICWHSFFGPSKTEDSILANRKQAEKLVSEIDPARRKEQPTVRPLMSQQERHALQQAALNGDNDAAYKLGLTLPASAEREHWLWLAAARNHTASQFSLWQFIAESRPQDALVANYWLHRAAMGGDPKAKEEANRLDLKPVLAQAPKAPSESRKTATSAPTTGLDMNEAEKRELRIAALNGNNNAALRIGLVSLLRDNNIGERERWLVLAAARNHADSQYSLWHFIMEYRTEDALVAQFWLHRAAQNGQINAQQEITHVNAKVNDKNVKTSKTP
jgi:TPR repeat protein